MSSAQLLQRPIYGGVFGEDGRFSLASTLSIENGLHSVRFLVIEPRDGRVLASAESKSGALAGARHLLAAVRAANDPEFSCDQPRLWPDAELPISFVPPPRPVSRRRREVFIASGGVCRYCGVPLKLDGLWHVDHAKPRALGGTDGLLNLAASCPACNLRKSDRTALEFVATSGSGWQASG